MASPTAPVAPTTAMFNFLFILFLCAIVRFGQILS
jgi:hypothetical protein